MIQTPTSKPVQLVKHLHKVPVKKRVFPALISEKFDGVFAFGLITKDDNRIFSRPGLESNSLKHLERGLNVMAQQVGFSEGVLIFEVYREGYNVGEINGGFSRKSEQFTDAIAMVHDWIPLDDFLKGESSMLYKYRASVAEALCKCPDLGDDFHYVLQTECACEEDALEAAELMWANGREGVILHDPNGTWKAGSRTERVAKIKCEEQAECKVLGVYPGEGKYLGTLGGIVVEYNGHECNISGMKDQERDDWWFNPDLIVGQTVLVEFMCESAHGKMREPRYKSIV